MNAYFQLIWSFFQIGILTFGGGYAMLPMLQREIVEKRQWATEEEILDYYAIGQCTPGIIAVNTATFIGYKQKKIPGAVAATFGLVLPSLLIISAIAALLQNFADYPVVQHAFGGIRVAVAVLVLNAVVKLFKGGVKGAFGIALFLASFLAVVLFDLSPVLVVLVALVCGLGYGVVTRKGAA
jgi:chromate transporter